MTRMMLVAAAAAAIVAGCQADNRNIERKLEEISKDLKDIKAQGARGAGAAAPRPQRVEPDRAKVYSMPIEGDAFDGPADAKVTLVKAYDYACPYCEKIRDTMDELRKRYGNDVRIVFKQLVVHPREAMASALAVCAANKQGKFLQMDQLLWDKGYKNRNFDKEVSEGGQTVRCWESPTGCQIVNGFAQELGFNVEKFKTDMKECMTLVQKDQRELQSFGVGATPSFFINGRFISGAQGVEKFVEVIDDELKKANERIAAGTPAASYYQQWVMDKGLKQLERPAQ
jgi:protein-disulfide isomerase